MSPVRSLEQSSTITTSSRCGTARIFCVTATSVASSLKAGMTTDKHVDMCDLRISSAAHRVPGSGSHRASDLPACPPGLEHDHRPQARAVCRSPRLQVAPRPKDLSRLEQAAASELRRVEKSVRPAPQRSAKPAIDWDRKSHFGPFDNRLWHSAIKNLAQNPFADTIAQLESMRQPPGELDHPMIEERGSDLETHRHARAIEFRQQVVRQVRQLISQHHAVEECDRFRRAEHRLVHMAGLVSVDQMRRPLPCRKQRAVHLANRRCGHELRELANAFSYT